jgi:CBS domain-containing protein
MANTNEVANVDISGVLSSIALEELLFSQTITVVRSTASVDQTLRVLAKHRILSAPVRSKSAESSLAALTIAEESVGNYGNRGGGDGHQDAGSGVVPESPVTPSGKLSGFIDIRDVLSSFLKELDLSQIKDAKMLRKMRILEEKGQVRFFWSLVVICVWETAVGGDKN